MAEPIIDWGNPETLQNFFDQVTDRRHSDQHFSELSVSSEKYPTGSIVFGSNPGGSFESRICFFAFDRGPGETVYLGDGGWFSRRLGSMREKKSCPFHILIPDHGGLMLHFL